MLDSMSQCFIAKRWKKERKIVLILETELNWRGIEAFN
jgi:hypothetical protein